MTIEGGARAGLIQPDEKTFKYLENRPLSPKKDNWKKALDYWNNLKSDKDCKFDKEIVLMVKMSFHKLLGAHLHKMLFQLMDQFLIQKKKKIMTGVRLWKDH